MMKDGTDRKETADNTAAVRSHRFGVEGEGTRTGVQIEWVTPPPGLHLGLSSPMASASPVSASQLDASLRAVAGHTQGKVIALVELSGELDAATAPRLADLLARAQGAGIDAVVLEVSGLEFIDTAGLAVIVAAHRRARAGDAAAPALASPSRVVRRAVEMTRLDRLLILSDTPTEAAATLLRFFESPASSTRPDWYASPT
jgi:anti-sigma B factor antagonist